MRNASELFSTANRVSTLPFPRHGLDPDARFLLLLHQPAGVITLSLLEELQRARTEEDVKDAYIRALGLKDVRKGLVDIQTAEIWFEAKEAPIPPLLMFAQLLVYVRAARKRGEAIPGFLCVIDREKAALMAT